MNKQVEWLKRIAALDKARIRSYRRRAHRFEEAHDDPAPASLCWNCLLPRDAKVHQ